MTNSCTLELNLKAFDTFDDVEGAIDLLKLDRDDELVQAIIRTADDFKKRKGLRQYLKGINAEVIFLNLEF